jgi:hypothetical protein
VNATADTSRRVSAVSPLQAAIGTLFGGPIAFAYFVRRNYIVVGDAAAARNTLWACAVLVLASSAVIAFGILMPEPVPIVLNGILVAPFALAVAAYWIARRQIASQDRPPMFCSAWSIVGCTALCVVASAACALVTIIGALLFLIANSGFR